MTPRRILITGGEGYLGSVLVGMWRPRFDEVVVVDDGSISGVRLPLPGVQYVRGSVADPQEWEHEISPGTALVHLAAIVGDPACGVDEEYAWETNYLGTVRVAEAAARRKATGFVLASSCSNYGISDAGSAGVNSPLNPQSAYANSKVLSEHHVLSLRSATFRPTILRFATLYGLSPRMRFDLAVNAMTASAVNRGVISVHGGQQWRPFLHVRDAASCLAQATLEPPRSPILNCGFDEENYQLLDVARIVAQEVPGATVRIDGSIVDHRSYRVDFTGTSAALRVKREYDVRRGVREIVAAFAAGEIADYEDDRHSNHRIALARKSSIAV